MNDPLYGVGMDLGLRTFGLASVQLSGPGGVRVCDMRFWGRDSDPDTGVTEDRQARVLELGDVLRDYLAEWHPVVVMAEVSWMMRGHRAVVSLAMAFAAVQTICGEFGLPLVCCDPKQLKRAVMRRKKPGKVTDETLRARLCAYYPGAAELTADIVKTKLQHPFDALGAVETLRLTRVVLDAVHRR